MMLRDYKPYFYIVGVTLLSWWLAKLTGLDDLNRAATPPHSPDYFSKGYVKLEMDSVGQLNSKLLAEQMVHYSDDKTTHTVKPVMFFYNDTTPPWVIKSETSILSADGKDLWLNGKVNVNRAKAEGVTELIINTSNLKVKPETSYAETVDWAELLSPPNVTTGTGMKLVFAEPIHLELLSNVKGKYETKK
ncbi:MAG: LPS export ABC transporter periplasmic protein LptC [Methylococcales bacterium]